MKNELNQNLTNIRNFFELIFTQGNATKEEVNNFLRECLNYIMAENSLDPNEYTVIFHFVPSKLGRNSNKKLSKSQIEENMLMGGYSAYVEGDEKDDKKFDVYFPKELASFKITSPFHCGKNRDYDQALDEYIESFGKYFDFIFTAMHEFSHIMQYILTPDIMASTDETAINHMKVEYALRKYMPNSKDKRLFLRILEKYFEAASYTSACEADADEQATQYYIDLLCQLTNAEKCAQLKDFFLANYQFVEFAHRRSKKNQYIFKPQYYETMAKLDAIYEGQHENKNLTIQLDEALGRLELEDC